MARVFITKKEIQVSDVISCCWGLQLPPCLHIKNQCFFYVIPLTLFSPESVLIGWPFCVQAESKTLTHL